MDSTENIPSIKESIRREMRSVLQQLTANEYACYNRQLQERFFSLDLLRKTKRIMIYYGIGNEVDTVPLIIWLLNEGKQVGLPICTSDLDLNVGWIESLEDVEERKFNRFSLVEPRANRPLLEPSDLDLAVIPGLAFDQQGNRLGHGAGYYDRFLRKVSDRTYKLGLAYDFQVLDSLPVAKHDQSLNGLLTPIRFFKITN